MSDDSINRWFLAASYL